MESYKFRQDQEISFLEDGDLLDYSKYIEPITAVIEHCPAPFTIGLFGEWGTGKSSILKTVQDNLTKNSTKRYKFVHFDTWRNSDSTLPRALVMDAAAQLKIPAEKLNTQIYGDVVKEAAQEWNVSKRGLVFSVLAVAALLISFSFFPPAGEFSPHSFLLIVLVVLALGKDLFYTTKTTYSSPVMSEPSDFQKEFSKVLELSEPSFACFNRAESRHVVVLDNLDRCDPDSVVQLLSVIKPFVQTNNNVVFVIPVDDRALRDHLADTFLGQEGAASEFLSKLVDSTFYLRTLTPKDLYSFIDQSSHAMGLNLSPDSVELIARTAATTPRRVNQFLNDLVSELLFLESSHGREFVRDNELLVCALLIIRSRWPSRHSNLTADSTCLSKWMEMGGQEESDERFKNFISFVAPLKNDELDHAVGKILSTAGSKLDAPDWLVSWVHQNDPPDSIIELEEVDRTRSFRFLIEECEAAINRGSVRTGLVHRLRILADIIEYFSPAQVRSFDRFLGRADVFAALTAKRLDAEQFCKLFGVLSEVSPHGCFERFVSYLESVADEAVSGQQEDTLKTVESYVRGLLRALHQRRLSRLRNIVSVIYKSGYLSLKDFEEGVEGRHPAATTELTSEFVDRFEDGRELAESGALACKLLPLNKMNVRKILKRLAQLICSQDAQEKSEDLERYFNHWCAVIAELRDRPELLDGGDGDDSLNDVVKELETTRPRVSGTDTQQVRGVSLVSSSVSSDDLSEVVLTHYQTFKGRPSVLELCRVLSLEVGLDDIYSDLESIVRRRDYKGVNITEFILSNRRWSKAGLSLLWHFMGEKGSQGKELEEQQKRDVFAELLEKVSDSDISSWLQTKVQTQKNKRLLRRIAQEWSPERVEELCENVGDWALDLVSEGDNIFKFYGNEAIVAKMLGSDKEGHHRAIFRVVLNLITKDESKADALRLLSKFESFKHIRKAEFEAVKADVLGLPDVFEDVDIGELKKKLKKT